MKNTIALYIGSLAIGGAERVISQLANGLVAMEYRIILITTYQKMNEYAIRDGVERIILDQGSTTHNGLGKNIKYIMQIREICRNNNVAIIISFMREPNVRALLATVGLRTKNIISVRNDPLREYPGFIGKLICKCLFPIADACVFQTEKAKSFFPVGIRKKSRVILNPIAKEFFSVKRNDLQNVVTVCRLEQQKNIGLLIRAFAKIEKEYPAEKLLIYGEGEQKRELKALIDKLAKGESIWFKSSKLSTCSKIL